MATQRGEAGADNLRQPWRLQLARPIMRSGARLDADQAWWQLLEKRYDLSTLQLPANNHLASSINAVHLKD